MRAVLKGVGLFLGGVPQWIYIAIAIGAAALWLDHNGAARATAEAETRRLERQQDAQAIVNAMGRYVRSQLAELGRRTADTIQQIDREDQTIVQPIIREAIAKDPNLGARACLTPELLKAVNVSRGYPQGAAGGAVPDQRASPPRLPGSTGDR